MTHEIPSDDTVCMVLSQLSNGTARDLLDALIAKKYDNLDAQRGIQRCIDRGRIVIGRGFVLTVSQRAGRVLEAA